MPKTINYPFKKLSACSLILISSSEDGKFRIYSIDRNRQRSMPYFFNIFQFNVNGKVMSKEIAAQSPDYTYYEVHDMILNGKTYYITQRIAYGELTNPLYIRIFSIEDNGLNEGVKLIKTDKGLVNVLPCGEVNSLADDTTKYRVNYNKANQSFSIPVVENGRITKKHVTYKFNGRYFVRF